MSALASRLLACCAILPLVALGGCFRMTADDTASDADAVLTPVSDTRLLRRMSLDLRGVLPSVGDYEQVEQDPSALQALLNTYLEDPLFEERLVFVFAEHWHTMIDEFNGQSYDYQMDEDEAYDFERAVGEEPLRLMAHIVANDLPWSDILLADYSMANEITAAIWPIDEYPTDGTGWHPIRYTDGRPAAGVLATNGLWWRYPTTQFNQNRARAAAISKLLVCEDMLVRPISFSAGANLLSTEDPTTMTTVEPSCLACHSILEPLAAAMFGFYWVDEYAIDEIERYHPEREVLGPQLLGVEPAFFGTPIVGLADLGETILEDPRFTACATEQMLESYLRRRLTDADQTRLRTLTTTFESRDLQLKSLIREILNTNAYQAGGFTEEATSEDHDRENTARLMAPSQLMSLHANLTGFEWVAGGYNLFDNDEKGYRVLAGGVDGQYLTSPQQSPGVTWTLVHKRVAEASATLGVESELVEGETRRLFGAEITLANAPGDTVFDNEIERLYLRLLGSRPTAEQVESFGMLWSSLEQLVGAKEAWIGVVAALLRDPAFGVY